jgi:hypothetical protein
VNEHRALVEVHRPPGQRPLAGVEDVVEVRVVPAKPWRRRTPGTPPTTIETEAHAVCVGVFHVDDTGVGDDRAVEEGRVEDGPEAEDHGGAGIERTVGGARSRR